MFYKTSYRRGVIEGVILYALGRLGALVTPAFFPDWLYVAAPLLFLCLQYLAGPIWASYRIKSTRRERLSRRFWLLGPRMAGICFAIDIVLSLTVGLSLFPGDVQRGPVLMRLFVSGANSLSLQAYALYELRTGSLLLALFTIWVICSRLAQGGFLRFTMPAGGNRVTL